MSLLNTVSAPGEALAADTCWRYGLDPVSGTDIASANYRLLETVSAGVTTITEENNYPLTVGSRLFLVRSQKRWTNGVQDQSTLQITQYDPSTGVSLGLPVAITAGVDHFTIVGESVYYLQAASGGWDLRRADLSAFALGSTLVRTISLSGHLQQFMAVGSRLAFLTEELTGVFASTYKIKFLDLDEDAGSLHTAYTVTYNSPTVRRLLGVQAGSDAVYLCEGANSGFGGSIAEIYVSRLVLRNTSGVGLATSISATSVTFTLGYGEISHFATLPGGTTGAGACVAAYVDSHEGRVALAVVRYLSGANRIAEFRVIDEATGEENASGTLNVPVDLKVLHTRSPIQFMMLSPR